MEGFAEIIGLDRDWTLALNSWHNPVTDAVWLFFSHVQIWYAMYLIIIVFLFIRLGWKRALAVTLSCILFVVACDQFANIVKAFVQRLRPMEDSDMLERGLNVLEGAGGMYGFFSAHAANAMGFAVCSTMGFHNDRRLSYRGYAIFIYTWALLVGISRVFVGKHFLGDVLVGFAVGLLLGWLFGVIGRLIIKKIDKKGATT